MTSYATNITPSAAPPRDRTGAVVAMVVGGLAAVVAFVLLAGAGTLLWASHYKTDDDLALVAALRAAQVHPPRVVLDGGPVERVHVVGATGGAELEGGGALGPA